MDTSSSHAQTLTRSILNRSYVGITIGGARVAAVVAADEGNNDGNTDNDGGKRADSNSV
jgi:hypothetical protein